MIVQCTVCGSCFEDEYRSWVCPHDAFPANDGHNNFKVHDDAPLYPAPPVTEIGYHSVAPDIIAEAQDE